MVEHQEASFEIDVEADDADVSWFQNGQEIKPDGKRVVIVADGKKRKLVIKDTLLSDAGEITCKTNTDEAGCKLDVARKSMNTILNTLSQNY